MGDFPQVKPFNDIDYVVKTTALYNGPPEGTYGYTLNTREEKINYGIDGVGEPAFVYELRPHSDSYWYGLQRRMVGMKSLSSWYEEAYDHKGEIFRLRVNRRGLAAEDPRLRNKEGPFMGNKGQTYPALHGWGTHVGRRTHHRSEYRVPNVLVHDRVLVRLPVDAARYREP